MSEEVKQEGSSARPRTPFTAAFEGWRVFFGSNGEGREALLADVAAWDADGHPLIAPNTRRLVTAEEYATAAGYKAWSVTFYTPMRGCGCA